MLPFVTGSIPCKTVSLPDDGRITDFAAIQEIPELFMKEETPFPYLQKKRGIFWKIIGMDLSDLHSREKIFFCGISRVLPLDNSSLFCYNNK